VRHQLLILNRGRKRAPNLRTMDRIIGGLCTLFMRPARILHSAIVLKPSTLLHLHTVLRKRKYRGLFSPRRRCRPGPNGSQKDLIEAIVALKRRYSRWGLSPHCFSRSRWLSACDMDKDVVHPPVILSEAKDQLFVVFDEKQQMFRSAQRANRGSGALLLLGIERCGERVSSVDADGLCAATNDD
jgi:hypothetical protein